MSIRKGFAEVPACVKASEARNFRKSRRLGSLMKSPPSAVGAVCSLRLRAAALALRGPPYRLFQRLDMHHVSVVVNVPDANRICRIVDPCSSIMRIGFGHLV